MSTVFLRKSAIWNDPLRLPPTYIAQAKLTERFNPVFTYSGKSL